MNLDLPVSTLDGVGPTLTKRLKHLEINTLRDLLFSYPFRYEDFSVQKPIKELVAGDEVTVKVQVELIANKRSKRKRMMLTEAVVSDGHDQLRVVWFNQPYLSKSLHTGDTILLSGKVTEDVFGTQMVSPSHEKVKAGAEDEKPKILAVYPLVAGVTQKQRSKLIAQVIDATDDVTEWLPEEIIDKIDVMPLPEALRAIHAPTTMHEANLAVQRLKFDELFLLQLRAERVRQAVQAGNAPELTFQEDAIKTFVDGLPFTLTKDQKVAAWEILQDLGKKTPMNRLLEGDVGSGKTVVAAVAAHNAILGGAQVAIMAPTDVLATQHYESFREMLGSNHTVGLLTRTKAHHTKLEAQDTGKSTKAQKEAFVSSLHAGDIDLVVGTHALLTEHIQFHNLGLVVIDEQHRFGVNQRKALKEKSGDEHTAVHFLSMTATPIPRSFALTLYGELDLSMIKQMPSGRKPIKTKLVDARRRGDAYTFIKAQVTQGRQVFVLCPLIEESDKGDTERKSVLQEYEKLSTHVFPDLNVAYLHGKMKPKEKDEVMEKFAAGETDVLVSTSVIEVGVNIPNATVMMIEGAERFGLAQLHQFRGRVGRSDHQSFCFVFAEDGSADVQERLQKFESTTDGFELAEYDLERRGPGEVYGRNQSGMMQFQLASLHDVELIKLARDMARGVDFAAHKQLSTKVDAWEEKVHLE